MGDESVSFTTASGEQIVLELAGYPPVNELLEILEEENVPLSFWPDIALGYWHLQRNDEYVTLLEKAGKKDVDKDFIKDQMKCMDLLAAYYVQTGKKLRNEKERKEYFSKATFLYTTTDKHMMYDPTHLVGRAFFCLLESVKWDQAKAQFDYVTNYRSSDISAIIGRALVNYASGDYKGALSYFRRALRCKPDLPAEVRLGFGHCYLKLKNYEKAQAAFNRVLKLDPTNLAARLALAVCYYYENPPVAEKAILACYNIDNTNPVILTQLTNMYFLNNDFEKAEETAWLAYHNAVQKDLKAESCYMIARCHHVKKEYDKAFRYYYQATQFGSSKFVLPYYGLGQIHLGRAEFDQAIECFEKVLAEYPEDYETLKVLGSIYTRWEGPIEDEEHRKLQRKGEEMLQKVHEMNPEDVEVIFELAQLEESSKPQDAIVKYEKGCVLLEKIEGFEIPCEVYCNMGALHFQLENYEKSKACYDRAETLLLSHDDSLAAEDIEAKLVVIHYNLGRLYEGMSRYDAAEEFYSDILSRKPNHFEVILRLGCICREKGETEKALEYYEQASALDVDNPTPYLLMAYMSLSTGGVMKEAQTKFETVLKLKDQKDNIYAFIGLGNIWLDTLYSIKSGEKDEKERMKKCREHATGCYLKVLKNNPTNAWAANGIGCVLAHRYELADAREIYSQAREATRDSSDAFLNLAHVFLETKQYKVAAQMYKTLMKRRNRQYDVQLLQYAARATWKAAEYDDCREFLERAAIEAPSNLLVRYSLSVILQSMATQVMREEKATLSQLRDATDDLKIAERSFIYLSKQPDEVMLKYRYISRTVCSKEAQTCNDLLAQAKQYYNRALKKETEDQRKQDEIKALREEQLRIRQEKEQEEQMRQQEQEDELRKQRAYYVEKTKEILKVSQTIEEKEKEKEGKKKSGGRRKKDREEDDFLNDSDERAHAEGGEERSRKKKEKRRKRKREDNDASASEGENKAPKKKRKSKKEKAAAVEEEVTRNKGKVKSRAYVSSSSSSDSEKEGPANPPKISDDETGAPQYPQISDDSDDLSDSSPEENNASETEQPAKRARIEEDSDDEEVAPAASPADSDEPVKAPESDSD